MSSAEKAPTVEAIVDRYVKLRDRKAQMKKEYEASVSAIDDALTRCENYLLGVLDQQGAESIKTGSGTAYVSTKATASVADKEAFLQFVRTSEEWAMLDVRANKTTVEQFRKEHHDNPPGVKWNELRTVNVRRS